MHDPYHWKQALDLPALEAALKRVFDATRSSPPQICVRLILQSAEAFALNKRRRGLMTIRKNEGRPFSRSASGFSDKEPRGVYRRLEQAVTNLIELLSKLFLFNDEPVEQSQPFKTGRFTNLHFSPHSGNLIIKPLRMIDPRIKSNAAHAFIGLILSSLRSIRSAVAGARQKINSTRGV